MENKLSGIREGIKWSALNAVSLIFAKVLRGAVVPKMLAPGGYGLFASVGLFTRYLQFADVGSAAHFVKEIPHFHFNKGADEKQRLVDRTFSLILLSFVLVALYLGGAALFYRGDHAVFYRASLLLLIPIAALSKLKEFLMSYSLGTQNYRLNAVAAMVNNYAGLLAVVAGVYFYGALGGVAGMLAAELAVFIYVARAVKLKASFSVSRETFRDWRQNIKQFSVSIVELVAATVDQIFILKVFDAACLGFYALGLTFSWLLESVSEVFNTASYPKIMAIVRRDRSAGADLIDQTIMCYLLSCVLILPASLYAIEIVVTYYFSQYVAGLDVYALMMFLGLLRGSVSLMRRGYIALDKEKRYVTLNAVLVAVYACALSAAWALSLSFGKVIVTVVGINLLAFILLYGGMSRQNGRLFWKNMTTACLAVGFLGAYQYAVRQTPFVLFRADMGLYFICGATAIFAAMAYRERALIASYFR